MSLAQSIVHFLPSGEREARALAARLGIAAAPIDVHRFPDGELRVTVAAAAATVILYASLDHPNDKLLALLFAAEALRRNGARRLVMVAPYLCYMRQDAAFRPGEAISQKVMGRLIAGACDRVVTVDAHLHRTPRIGDVFPGIAADNLSAMPAIADALAGRIEPDTVVVGPDVESRPWASDLAARLGTAVTVARKERRGDRSVEISFDEPQLLNGRAVLLVDDIVASGGTLIACAQTLVRLGARTVDAAVTHALFDPGVMRDFERAGIRSVRSTDSVPHPTNAIPLAAILAAAVRGDTGGPPEAPA